MYWYVQLTETLDNGATRYMGDVVVYALSAAGAMSIAEAQAQTMAGVVHATSARPASQRAGASGGVTG